MGKGVPVERISLNKTLNRQMSILLISLVTFLSIFYGNMRFLQLNSLVETAVETIASETQSTYIGSLLDGSTINAVNAKKFLFRNPHANVWMMIENARNEIVASTGGVYQLKTQTGHRMQEIEGVSLHVYSRVLVNDEGITLGRVHILTDKSFITKILVKETFFFIGLASIIAYMVFFLTSLFSKGVIKRLDELKTVSQKFANREFYQLAPTEPFDEIGQLGEVMNFMSKSWQEHHQYRGELFSRTAHNLKTPLTVMTTWVDYLKENPSEMEEGLNRIGAESEKLNHMIHVLLDDLIHGKEELYLSEVNIKTFIESELSKWKLALFRHQVKLEVELLDQKVQLDVYRMGQLIFNVIDNVIKYTPPKSTFSVSSFITKDLIRIDFEDSGPGLNSIHVKSLGHGLGMESIKNIASLHGGDAIWSNAALGGVKVSVSLPLCHI
jgi:signal transduction histidine kinase